MDEYKEIGRSLRDLAGNQRATNGHSRRILLRAANAIETLRKNQRVKGEWKNDGGVQVCSECGAEHEWSDYRASFCDECGADMRESNARYWEEHDE